MLTRDNMGCCPQVGPSRPLLRLLGWDVLERHVPGKESLDSSYSLPLMVITLVFSVIMHSSL